MACIQEKCSSNSDDINSFTAADNKESFIFKNKLTNSPHTMHHSNMDDDSYTVAENEASPISKNQCFYIDPDDNAVDGFDDSLPPLPICTSTPCSLHCQSRLLDSMACPRPDDSGLVCSFASYTSSSAVVSSQIDTSCASRLSTATHALSLSDSQTDSPALSNLESSPFLMSSADFPCPKNIEATFTPAASSLKEEISQSPFTQRESFILSTPLSLPLSGSFTRHYMGTLVTSTPVDDADSPVPGQAFQNRRETPAGDADSSMADPLFCIHRPSSACKAECSSIPTPPLTLWDSPSQLPSKEQEESEVEDEAYFSSSHLSLTSPSLVCEDSIQSLSLEQRMKQVLSPFTPIVPDRLVGRNMGVGHFDIIAELHLRNLPAGGVLAWLSPYLQSADFIRMSGVCQRWRCITGRNKKVSMYRTLSWQIHSRPNNSEKENRLYRSKSGDGVLQMTRASACLKNIQTTAPSPTKRIRSKLELSEKVRKNLQWEELLRHCPLCHQTAKVVEGQEHAQCQNRQCGNNFCTRCLAPYHPTLPCPPHPHLLKDLPGGRKSKKQVKRIVNL